MNFTKDQQEAIEFKGNNILVSASAGSGKTAVLVERVIDKVINEKIDIDKILVVTFTNASSLELRERLTKAIYKRLEEDKNNKFLRKQLENINRAYITTIHSFCLSIVRSNFHILGIDPNINICDEETVNNLTLKAFTKVLEERYKGYKEDQFGIYNLLKLFNFKDEEFIDYLIKLYKYINSFPNPLVWLYEKIEMYNIEDCNLDASSYIFGKEIYNKIINDFSSVIFKIDEFEKKLYNKEEFVKYIEMLDKDRKVFLKVKEAKSIDEIYNVFSNIPSLTRKPSKKVQDESLKEDLDNFRDKVIKDTYNKAKDVIYEKSEKMLEDVKSMYKYLKFIYYYIQEADELYKEYKSDKNVIDFNDIEHFCLKILIDEENNLTNEALLLKDKFYEVYTDEYQDTSYIQEVILSSVSKFNNRFIVGDIKQSIYKFRGAVPELFNEKYKLYKNEEYGKRIILSKNFRSRKEVLFSINHIFSNIMSYDLGECEYEEEEFLKHGNLSFKENDKLNYKTEINILDNIKDYENDELKELKSFEIEAKYIARRISKLVNNFSVYDLKTETFRKCKYKDIVILLRSDGNKSKILKKEMESLDIPCFSDNEESVYNSDEVKLALSFLKVIDNFYQDIELISVMYSIIGKFTLDEIVKIRDVSKKDYIYDCLLEYSKEDYLKEKIKEFLLLINKFITYSKIYNISEMLSRLYKETYIYDSMYLLNNSSKARNNLDSLIIKAESLSSVNSIYSFVSYIESLNIKYSNNTSPKLIGENEDVVRIMTIHKSKGLEFPVVILADTSKKYNDRDKKAVINTDYDLGVGINILNEDYNVSYPSIVKEAIKNRLDKSLKSEELRILYVALTRAKEKLIIYGASKDYDKIKRNIYVLKNDKNKIDSNIISVNNKYLDNILYGIYDIDDSNDLFDINIINVSNDSLDLNYKFETSNIKYIKDMISNSNMKDNKEEDNSVEINYDFSNSNIETKVSVSELKNEDKEIKLLVPEFIEKSNFSGARKGTLIHFILEHLDFNKVNDLKDFKIYLKKLLDDNVISNLDFKNINLNYINNFLKSNIYNDIKSSSKVKREQEFVLKDKTISKSIIQGVIDLYYLNNDNTYTLLDFKSDNLLDEKEYITRYKKQLYIYKVAIEKLTKVKVDKVYIYSFKLGKEIEIV